jgi:hypothetical protein
MSEAMSRGADSGGEDGDGATARRALPAETVADRNRRVIGKR